MTKNKESVNVYSSFFYFLSCILVIALVAKNQSLLIAVAAVMILKLFFDGTKLMALIQTKGIHWGVTIITIAILIPIATGQIGFKDLYEAFKTPVGWVALASGIAVAILSARGIKLMGTDPQVTVALVMGTILGVVFLKGVAAGPVIASGITYVIMQGLSYFIK
ncbi:DUF441 domain-containing protein [Brochothrix campestris]|uniref:DUF441 domain-containing protein n=1 Tax=Brochothrix campestris TaxID=2757 RepID=UPI000A02A072